MVINLGIFDLWYPDGRLLWKNPWKEVGRLAPEPEGEITRAECFLKKFSEDSAGDDRV